MTSWWASCIEPRAAFWTPALPLRPTNLAAIERSVNVRRWLFPGRIGVQVPRQFHRVVQYPTDYE